MNTHYLSWKAASAAMHATRRTAITMPATAPPLSPPPWLTSMISYARLVNPMIINDNAGHATSVTYRPTKGGRSEGRYELHLLILRSVSFNKLLIVSLLA